MIPWASRELALFYACKKLAQKNAFVIVDGDIEVLRGNHMNATEQALYLEENNLKITDETIKSINENLLEIRNALKATNDALRMAKHANNLLSEQLLEANKQSERDKETIRRLRLTIDQDSSCSTLLE